MIKTIRMNSVLFRRLPALLLGVGALLVASPARALEEIELRLPVVETSFTVNLKELRDQQTLLSGSSDLAQLDQATDGQIGRQLLKALQTPLPLPARAFAEQSAGSPLLNQVLLLLSALVEVEGVPQPIDSEALAASLAASRDKEHLTLLEVLEALPGRSASVDLQRVLTAIDRVTRSTAPGQDVAGLPAGRRDRPGPPSGRTPGREAPGTGDPRDPPPQAPAAGDDPARDGRQWPAAGLDRRRLHGRRRGGPWPGRSLPAACGRLGGHGASPGGRDRSPQDAADRPESLDRRRHVAPPERLP